MSLVFIIALLNVGISSSRYLLLQLNNSSPWEDRIEKHELGQKDFNSYGTIISLDLNKQLVFLFYVVCYVYRFMIFFIHINF